MGRACSTYGKREKMHTELSENMNERGHSEHFGVYGRIILEWILMK
jgi:hypothetical protein